MSDIDDVPHGEDLTRGETDLRAATDDLRSARPTPRVVEIADAVLQRALAAPRRATWVRAPEPRSFLMVSSLVITATIREHLDRRLVGAAVSRVLLDVTRTGELSAVTIELYVQYGSVVHDVADRARVLAGESLDSMLGSTADTSQPPVAVSHVHVADVTTGDPHVVDPHDEAQDAASPPPSAQ